MDNEWAQVMITDGNGKQRMVWYNKTTGEMQYSAPMDTADEAGSVMMASRNPNNPNEIRFGQYGVEGGVYWDRGHVLQGADNWQRNDSTEKDTRKRVEPIIKKQQDGGHMNYSKYLKQGGQIPQELIQSYQEDPETTIEQLLQLGDEGTEYLQALAELDPNVEQYVQEIMANMQEDNSENTEFMRKGGCVKKSNKGRKIAKKASGNKVCKCIVKRSGGTLVEVDSCTGKRVSKTSKLSVGGTMIPKGQKAFRGGVSRIGDFDADAFMKQFDQDVADARALGKAKPGTTLTTYDPLVATASFNPVPNYIYIPRVSFQPINFGDRLRYQFFTDAPVETPAQETTQDNNGSGNSASGNASAVRNENRWGKGLKGKINGYTYDEALARQNEMLNAEGFNAVLAGRNRGADGFWGKTSMAEWERYLKFKADKEKAKAAEEAAKNYGNDMTNRQLIDYDPDAEGAQTLSAEAAVRRQRLVDWEAQQAKAQRDALVYKGTQYNDATSYNAAVDADNAFEQHRAMVNATEQGRTANDKYTARRFENTAQNMNADNGLKFILSRQYSSPEARQFAIDRYLKDHYRGPELIRMRRIAYNYQAPTAGKHFVDPSKQLTAEQLNAKTFNPASNVDFSQNVVERPELIAPVSAPATSQATPTARQIIATNPGLAIAHPASAYDAATLAATGQGIEALGYHAEGGKLSKFNTVKLSYKNLL